MKIRNKLVAVLCAMSCIMCLAGCGGAEDSASKKDNEITENSDSKGNVADSEKEEGDTFSAGDNEEEKIEIFLTLNDVKYDLMGNFNETVGKMVQDGLIVYKGTGFTIAGIDENGQMIAQNYDDNGDLNTLSWSDYASVEEVERPNRIYALTYKNELVSESYTVNEYWVSSEFLASYETLNYITQDSTKEEVLQAEGGHMVDKPGSAQVVHYLYVDGKQIDISEYEEEARIFYCEDNTKYEIYEDNINSIIMTVRNTWAVKSFDIRWFNHIEKIKETPEDKIEERIDYLTIFLALSDAFEMLKNDEADSVCIVTCNAEAPRMVHYAIYQRNDEK